MDCPKSRPARGSRLYSIVLLPLLFALAASEGKVPLDRAVLTGTVVDVMTGKPVAKALVVVPELDRTGKTDGRGRFVIHGIPIRKEPYEIMVRAFGYKTWSGDTTFSGKGVVKTEFRIKPLGY